MPVSKEGSTRSSGPRPKVYGTLPGEPEVIALIVTRFREAEPIVRMVDGVARPGRRHYGLADIARALNGMGHRTRTGRTWRDETVRSVVRRHKGQG